MSYSATERGVTAHPDVGARGKTNQTGAPCPSYSAAAGFRPSPSKVTEQSPAVSMHTPLPSNRVVPKHQAAPLLAPHRNLLDPTAKPPPSAPLSTETTQIGHAGPLPYGRARHKACLLECNCPQRPVPPTQIRTVAPGPVLRERAGPPAARACWWGEHCHRGPSLGT